MSHQLKAFFSFLKRFPDPVRRICLAVSAGLFVSVVIFAAPVPLFGRLIERMEQTTLDFRYDFQMTYLEPPQSPIEDIIIVDIDARSLAKMGRYGRWPRSFHATLVDYLEEGKTKLLGFDILFAGEEDTTGDDHQLAESVRRAGTVYTAVYLLPADSASFLYAMGNDPYSVWSPHSTIHLPQRIRQHLATVERIEGPYPELAKATSGLVAVNSWPDQDGVHRAVPLALNFAGGTYPALSLRLAMAALGLEPDEQQTGQEQVLSLTGQRDIPIDNEGRMLLRYYGRGGPKAQTFRYVSYYDVYAKNLPAEFFEGKIVLVGSSLPGMGDLLSVPFGAAFPGVELHATAIQNILTDDFLTKMTPGATFLTILGLSILTSILALTLRPWKGAVLTLGLVVAYFLLALVIFIRDGFWMEVVRPEGVVLLSYVAPLMYRYFTEERERRQMKQAFQQYVSPLVVEEVTRDPSKLRLGGEKRVLTMLFSDLAGFTSVSEKLPPESLCLLLNEYLTAMTDIILSHDGTIDKYEGDLIMALFGAPAWREDHAVRACRAALDMQACLARLRGQWTREGKPALYARIGINTGEVVVGNMGSKTRMDYTVIGDAVNLASRLEGANKLYGTNLMISEMTFEMVAGQFLVRELDLIRVQGKQRPVAVYEVLGVTGEPVAPEQGQLLDRYASGLCAYRDRQWDDAEAAFRAALAMNSDDGPSKIYLSRCAAHRKVPPPSDWDGVFQMETK